MQDRSCAGTRNIKSHVPREHSMRGYFRWYGERGMVGRLAEKIGSAFSADGVPTAMIILNPYDAKVAYSMIRAARRIKPSHTDYDPVEKYIYLWIAFNNIYQTVTDYKGKSPRFSYLPDGTIETKPEGSVLLPRVVGMPTERDQIDVTVEEFDDELKRRLLDHDSTTFFVYRTPRWHGAPITHDVRGQRLNGVLLVSRTLSRDNPIWSPIDTETYERYSSGRKITQEEFNSLVKQVVNVLYTVRNNLFHGGKRMDDSNDVDVVKNAIPLLQLIVFAFTRQRG